MKFIGLFVLFLIVHLTEASTKCVWATGVIRCEKDSRFHSRIKVYLLDRDGYGILQLIDSDDLMSVTMTDENGAFEINGCGSDPDFLGIIQNNPDPYIAIKHFCNGPNSEWAILPEIRKFVPSFHDAGFIDLDRRSFTQDSNWIARRLDEINSS